MYLFTWIRYSKKEKAIKFNGGNFTLFKNIKWSVYWINFYHASVGLGILIGGIWACYIYKDLQQNKVAKLQLEKIEREVIGFNSLQINLEIEQTKNKIDGFYGLIINSRIENFCAENIKVSLERNKYGLKIFYVNNNPSLPFLELKQNLMPVREMVKDVNAKSGYYIFIDNGFLIYGFGKGDFLFYGTVNKEGMYYAFLKIPVSDSLTTIFEAQQEYFPDWRSVPNSLRPDSVKLYWSGNKYFEVRS